MQDSRYDRKDFNVDFFSGDEKSGDEDFSIFSVLESISQHTTAPHYTLGSFDYQLRGLAVSGNTIKGILAKFRTSELPHAGGPDGEERELGLNNQEGLIEKNHFVVKRDKCVVMFQRNGHAARIGRLSEYLTQYKNVTIVFNPILQRDSVERMLDNNLKPVSLELSYAPPTNPELFPNNDWGGRLAKLADLGNGSRVRLTLSADRRTDDTTKHTLASSLKESVIDLVDSRRASVARINLTDGVCDYPIDLIADRITASKRVEMRGRYPVPDSMYSALEEAYTERRGEINEIFGEPDRRLN